MSSKYCISNSTLPIVSNSPLDETYYPPQEADSSDQTLFNNFENDDCDKYCSSTWKIKTSIDQADKINEVILDRRWEILKTRYLKAPTLYGDEELHFESIEIPVDFENFKIPISIRSKELHIFLCTQNTVKSTCVWFMLQAYDQTLTVVRHCTDNKIPTINRIWPKEPCAKKLKQIEHPNQNLFLSEDHWSNIVVEKQNLSWKILHNQKEIISYEGNDEKYNFMIFHAKTTNALLKIHQYHYLYAETGSNNQIGPKLQTNVRCIKFFVKMCDECMLDVTVSEDNNIAEQSIHQAKFWTEIQINLPNRTKIATMYFFPKTKSNSIQPFWAVDDFSDCTNDFRWIPKPKFASCELVNGQGNLQIKYKNFNKHDAQVPDDVCEDQIGIKGKCLACQNKICGESKYCELDESSNLNCYCPSGTFPKKNECKKCNPEYFGVNCTKRCDTCQSGCKYNGECIDGACITGYFGAKCDKPEYPIFKYPPKIYNIKPTSVEVKMEDLTILGNNSYKKYVIQYKSVNEQSWTDLDFRQITDTYQGTIRNLIPETKYQIRTKLLFRETRRSKARLDKIETFDTPCTEITRNQIETESTNTSVELIFKIILPENCNYKNYSILNPNIATERKSHSINALYLQSYTDYDIYLGNNKHNLTIHVKTKEGLPSQVRDIKITSITSNKATLSWKSPSLPNGKITHYEINYKSIKSRISNCALEKEKNEQKQTENKNSAQLTGLEPYKIYTVKIVAFTKKGEGLPNEEKFETEASDLISDEIDFTVFPYERYAKTEFKYDLCNLQGPITVYANVTCLSIWCQNETRITDRKDITKTKLYIIYNLTPYTNYLVTLFICNEVDCKPSSRNTNITTKSSEPNDVKNETVYARDETYLALRWLPPYPPYSEVTYYYLTIERHQYWRKHFTTHCPMEYCSIWKNYICCRITEDIKNGYTYSIKIYAINKQGQQSRGVEIKDIQSKRAIPSAPEFPSASWNEENKLVLSWNHPDRPNGQIKSFVYRINTDENRYYVKEEALTYSVKVSSPVPAESELSIELYACSLYGCSYTTQTKTTSPPPIPKIEDNNFDFHPNNKTINITLPKIERVCKKCDTIMQLAISEGSTKNTDSFIDFNESVIFEFDSSYRQDNVLIGNGDEMYSKFFNKTIKNPPLKPGLYYTLCIRVINSYKNKRTQLKKSWKINTSGNPQVQKLTPEEESNFNLLYLIFLILPIIAVAVFVFIRRKKSTSILEVESDAGPQTDEPLNVVDTPTSNVILKPTIKEKPRVLKSYKMLGTTHSKLVLLDRFEKYVKTCLSNDDFQRQHAMFRKGQLFDWKYAALKENKSKNRYSNLLAYDHSRVVLEQIGGDEYSDYINASYIDGYNTKNAYIATQGPKLTTLNDFWRMIWQENVKHIVMLANVFENNKKKVEQYWPNINETITFGEITVSFISEDIVANYTSREFSISKSGEEKKVNQLHFTTWPDHGIPLYSQSLVPFLDKMMEIELKENSPIVIHCSAGVGRTGTIILCDMTLRLAKAEKKVDIVNYLDYIRSRRANMVDNFEQFKLVHLVVLEYLKGMRTGIPCDENMKIKVQQVISSDVEEQLKYLKDIEWQDQAMKTIIDITDIPLISEKNRFNSIVPEPSGLVYLTPYPTDDPASSYINAVYVEGFLNPNRFIATQQPLPNTFVDFWRLVVESGSTVIVSLNKINLEDKTLCKFWLENNESMQITDDIIIEHASTEEYDIFQIVCVHVRTGDNKYLVEILLYNDWAFDQPIPNNIQQFVSFLEEADTLLRKSNPAIVTCYNGATACGIFLAMSFIIEKMKLEHECDVCQAVRYIRHNRKQFISDKEQFVFLYKAAVEYIGGFQSYANFS